MIGKEMASYRDLPTGKHDMQVMTSPENAKALENLVEAEQELLSLVEEQVGKHRQMLDVLVDAARGDTGER